MSSTTPLDAAVAYAESDEWHKQQIMSVPMTVAQHELLCAIVQEARNTMSDDPLIDDLIETLMPEDENDHYDWRL